jgi:iron complex transport system ATP-binding protein
VTPAVRAVDLVLAYGTNVAVDRSTFEIPTGGVTAVIGPNGSGKSTLLSAIAGLIEPADGSIEVHAHEDARRISYVLQVTKVNDALPVTVREVVLMGRFAGAGPFRSVGTADDRAAVQEAMERVGIADLANRHLRELSGGERQRVFVAQGLAQHHDILLLDEPLTGIDVAAAQAIDGVIHDERSRGCSIIMTTHDLTEAQAADHVVLVSGKVIGSGPPDEVLTRDALNEAYGSSFLHSEDGGWMLDDPAHRPADLGHNHGSVPPSPRRERPTDG